MFIFLNFDQRLSPGRTVVRFYTHSLFPVLYNAKRLFPSVNFDHFQQITHLWFEDVCKFFEAPNFTHWDLFRLIKLSLAVLLSGVCRGLHVRELPPMWPPRSTTIFQVVECPWSWSVELLANGALDFSTSAHHASAWSSLLQSWGWNHMICSFDPNGPMTWKLSCWFKMCYTCWCCDNDPVRIMIMTHDYDHSRYIPLVLGPGSFAASIMAFAVVRNLRKNRICHQIAAVPHLLSAYGEGSDWSAFTDSPPNSNVVLFICWNGWWVIQHNACRMEGDMASLQRHCQETLQATSYLSKPYLTPDL